MGNPSTLHICTVMSIYKWLSYLVKDIVWPSKDQFSIIKIFQTLINFVSVTCLTLKEINWIYISVEKTRVQLSGGGDGDYINASHVKVPVVYLIPFSNKCCNHQNKLLRYWIGNIQNLTWYISHEIQHHSENTQPVLIDSSLTFRKGIFFTYEIFIFTSFVAYSRFPLEMMFITTLQLRYIFLNEIFCFMAIGSMTVNGDFFSTFLVWSKLIDSNSLKNHSKL